MKKISFIFLCFCFFTHYAYADVSSVAYANRAAATLTGISPGTEFTGKSGIASVNYVMRLIDSLNSNSPYSKNTNFAGASSTGIATPDFIQREIAGKFNCLGAGGYKIADGANTGKCAICPQNYYCLVDNSGATSCATVGINFTTAAVGSDINIRATGKSVANDCKHIDINLANWMSHISDSKDVRKLWIPGSHDSLTYLASSSMSKCQTQTLETQLANGVRHFDLRPLYSDGVLKIYHGLDDMGITLGEVFAKFRTFLNNNPSEVILYRIWREDANALNPKPQTSDEYYNLIVSDMQSSGGQAYIDPATNFPGWTMGALRGKMLCMDYGSKNTDADKNMSAYAARTAPYVRGGGSAYSLLNSEYEIKWNEIQSMEIAGFDDSKFNMVTLNGVGGTFKISGQILMPNPEGFANAFTANRGADFLNLLNTHRGKHFIVSLDFEEKYAGGPGKLSADIIAFNFVNYNL